MATHLLHHSGSLDLEVPTEWTDRSRVVLEPIAAPSILGLYGFAGATFIVAAHLAGLYGSSTSALYLFPFAAIFGGLAQFIAGLFAFRARDGLGTAMHGMWGSFWLAYGILYAFVATGVIALPGTDFPELGFWFLVLAAITLVGTIAALADNAALVSVLLALTGGSVCLAVAYLAGSGVWETVGGYFLVVSAGFAFYTASAMVLEGSYGRRILPIGTMQGARRGHNVVGYDPPEGGPYGRVG